MQNLSDKERARLSRSPLDEFSDVPRLSLSLATLVRLSEDLLSVKSGESVRDELSVVHCSQELVFVDETWLLAWNSIEDVPTVLLPSRKNFLHDEVAVANHLAVRLIMH